MGRILVTGASGFIGSHICLVLLENGYRVIGIDSFENSSPESLKRVLNIWDKNGKDSHEFLEIIKGDIRDKKFIEKLFEKASSNNKPINAVIHLAGLKSVVDSVHNPFKYWEYNVMGSLNLFRVMNAFKCRTLVFSSSATIYEQSNKSLKEDTPIDPINPYGRSKAVIENLLLDIYSTPNSNWRIINLRYFNPIGAHESGMIGEDPKFASTNIFPLITSVALGKIKELKVFGDDWETRDGTCIRDYIHIMDLAEGHLSALRNLEKKSKEYLNINLGTGKGVTVLELISEFEKVTKTKVPFQFSERRSGDKVMSVANISLAFQLLNWQTKRTLEDMCIDGWKWQKLNPNGY